MNEEERLLLKRMNDLDHIADRKYMVCYSDFLNAVEYSLFLEHRNEYQCSTIVYTKIDQLERQMIAFIPEALNFNGEFPISILKIQAKSKKYAQKLSHRDILGTLMSLSIDRKLIGDIFISNNCYYVLVHERIAALVMQDIVRIKHTDVYITLADDENISIEQEYEERFATVASLRLDCVVAEINACSRSQAQELIKSGMVFCNYKQLFHNTLNCKEQDVISIRHVGKFRLKEIGGISKKGKIKISYEIYK